MFLEHRTHRATQFCTPAAYILKQNDQPVVPPPDYVPQSEISQESGLQSVSDPLEPDTLQPFPEEVLPHSMSNIDNLGTPPECDTPQNSPTCVDPDV